MRNIIDDICELTTINKRYINRLTTISKQSIAHATLEAYLNREKNISLNIGIGELQIELSADSVSYQFIPSKDLEELIVDSLQSKTSPITELVEETLANKIINTYKDLI